MTRSASRTHSVAGPRGVATARRRGTTYPANAWYVAGTSSEITRTPLARRALGVPVVLYRDEAGGVVALEDRDAHRPYPLSLGHLDGDLIVSGYSGFAYAPDGQCVRVPTQPQVPYGTAVRAFPAREQDSLVWIWLGEKAIAGQRSVPRAPWLTDPAWTTFGDAWETEANILLLHENFADITHVAVVDPYIAPPVLRAEPPPLEVEVSETSVSFQRNYPPARIAPWHAEAMGLSPDGEYAQVEEGAFLSPGMWMDAWHVVSDAGRQTFRFTHAVTPVSPTRTRHVWRVSRDFGPGSVTTEQLAPTFAAYYRRVQEILERMQDVLTTDGPRAEVSVNADAAALQVRRIVSRLVAEE